MSKPLRVLHLIHDSRRSGVPALASTLISYLNPDEVVSTVLFAHDGIYAADLRNQGKEVITLGARTPLLWRCKRFLAALLLPGLLRRIDVVHAHSVKMAPLALAAKLMGGRVLLHLHEKRTAGAFLRLVMATVDQVIYCADNCARRYADTPVKKGVTILNAVRMPAARVERTPVAGEVRRIVMLGSINRNKGQDILVGAFAELKPAFAELWLYGTVGISAHLFVRKLKKYIAARGLEKKVVLPGPTADAAAVFRQAHLLVHSSLNECLSISVLEAMSHGVPVIANDIDGMNEIITDGVNGFLVPPGDIGAMAARIALLLEDDRLWQKFSAAGFETVRQRFDMKDRSRSFVEVYRGVVE